MISRVPSGTLHHRPIQSLHGRSSANILSSTRNDGPRFIVLTR